MKVLPNEAGLFIFGEILATFAPQFHTHLNMKFLLFSIVLLVCEGIFAQTTAPAAVSTDTTIYATAETMPMPLLKGCRYDGSLDTARACAEPKFMALLAQNMIYPAEAQEKNLQGMVVCQFVVETDGKLSNFNILKDIGGGCGAEAIRILKAFDEAGARWLPGKQAGKLVRVRVNLPVRFKLEEALPYFIAPPGDTVFTQVDSPVEFRGGIDSLANYIFKNTVYPSDFRDSCRVGVVEMSLMIYPNGKVRVDNLLDFNNLGGDFQFNAIRLANRTEGFWTPAKYQNRAVTTTTPLRVVFKSDSKACSAQNQNFDKAILLANEALQLDESKTEEGIQKLSNALAFHPNNTEILYYRANLYIAQNKKEEACADFSKIKSLLGITWFENFGRIICGW